MALIIMIVIILILLGVGTKVIVDEKLISTTEEAVNVTNDKIAQEQTKADTLTGELTTVIQSQCTHEWGGWKVAKETTCAEAGEKTRICSKCDKVETAKIEKIPHNFENGVCTQCEQSLVIAAYVKGYNPSVGEDGQTITTSYVSKASKTGHNTDQTFTVTNIDKWMVLAEIDGQVVITPAQYIAPDGAERYYLKGKVGLTNCIDELHKVCSIYGQGKYADKTKYTVNIETETISTGGRSIKLEDAGFTKTNAASYTFTKNAETGNIEKDGETQWKNKEQGKALTYFQYYNEDTNEWLELQSGESITIWRNYGHYDGEWIEELLRPEGLNISNSPRYYFANRFCWVTDTDGDYGKGYGLYNNMFTRDGTLGHQCIVGFFGDEKNEAFGRPLQSQTNSFS